MKERPSSGNIICISHALIVASPVFSQQSDKNANSIKVHGAAELLESDRFPEAHGQKRYQLADRRSDARFGCYRRNEFTESNQKPHALLSSQSDASGYKQSKHSKEYVVTLPIKHTFTSL